MRLKLLISIVIGLFFLCGFSEFSIASISNISGQVQGVWFSQYEVPESFKWKAQWIWADETGNEEVILARKKFNMKGEAKKAIVRITASDQYQLFINGQYICRGPARCAPHHQYYDILDITSLIKKGDNLIAVRSIFEPGRKSYQNDSRAGLLVQMNLEDGFDKKEIISDHTWSIAVDQSWDRNSPAISRFQLFSNDKIDFRRKLEHWKQESFEEGSEWEPATALMRKVGWPGPQKNAKAQPLTPPWTLLIPRDIPYLKEGLISFKAIAQSFMVDQVAENKIKIPFQHLKIIDKRINYQNNSIVLPATDSKKSWVLLFDFGEIINGMPKMNLNGEEGGEIDVMTAPYMIDDVFSNRVVDFFANDALTLSGDEDAWEAINFKPVRYMVVVVHGNEKPVTLSNITIREWAYPFKRKGFITSNHWEWIEQYMDASAKTIDVCTTDALTDNYRERRQYAQTGFYGALGNYYTFGDLALQRRYLIQVAQEQLANGLMPAYAPLGTTDFMVILDSNCLYIRSLRNYFLYSGDEKTVKELLPQARKLMDLLNQYTNEMGMIDNPPYPYWLDHALNDRVGANLNLNGHYLGALRDFAEILEWLNMEDGAEYYKSAEKLRISLQKHLWDDERKLFADALLYGKLSDKFSEHANAMALAMNIATPEQAELIADELLEDDNHNYIFRESGVVMVTPAMSYFLHKGLCEYGYVDESMELFKRRFDKMLHPTTNQTLWEEWWLEGSGRTGKMNYSKSRSDAQTESAFPPALFAEYLLGIEPVKPGMSEIIVRHTQTDVNDIQAQIPTPQGIFSINKNSSGKESLIKLKIPKGVIVKLDIESYYNASKKTIKLNGKRMITKHDSGSFYEISEGEHQLEIK